MPELEKVQLQYLKYMLWVKKKPTLAIYAECGRFPLLVRQTLRLLKYWVKVKQCPQNSKLRDAYDAQTMMMQSGRQCWGTEVKKVLEKLGLDEYIRSNIHILKEKSLLNRIKEKMYKKEEERMMTEIQMCSPEAKIRTYKLFKPTSGMEPYLLINSLRPSRMYTIARFTLSSHTLGIETGRHKKNLKSCRATEVPTL